MNSSDEAILVMANKLSNTINDLVNEAVSRKVGMMCCNALHFKDRIERIPMQGSSKLYMDGKPLILIQVSESEPVSTSNNGLPEPITFGLTVRWRFFV